MERPRSPRLATCGLVGVLLCGAAGAQQPTENVPKVTPPQPTVPEIFTLMGQFVRVAYNQNGFVILGYRAAQDSVGDEWLLLEVGMTVRAPTPSLLLTRDALSLRTPDGRNIPLASQTEYAKADLRALNAHAKAVRDVINYFPVEATRPCTLQFFSEAGGRGPQISHDRVELSSDRACLGRLYFHVPGGIQVGQHWLDVQFGESEVQVPFRILTKDEEKQFRKSWQEIKKSHDASSR